MTITKSGSVTTGDQTIRTEPKKWNAGIADETWKVIICGRDLYRIDDLLSALAYYIGGEGGIEDVRRMSGAQIVGALEDHKRSSLLSVQRAIREREETQDAGL